MNILIYSVAECWLQSLRLCRERPPFHHLKKVLKVCLLVLLQQISLFGERNSITNPVRRVETVVYWRFSANPE